MVTLYQPISAHWQWPYGLALNKQGLFFHKRSFLPLICLFLAHSLLEEAYNHIEVIFCSLPALLWLHSLWKEACFFIKALFFSLLVFSWIQSLSIADYHPSKNIFSSLPSFPWPHSLLKRLSFPWKLFSDPCLPFFGPILYYPITTNFYSFAANFLDLFSITSVRALFCHLLAFSQYHSLQKEASYHTEAAFCSFPALL